MFRGMPPPIARTQRSPVGQSDALLHGISQWRGEVKDDG
jgi:hypothetical protein